MVRILLAFAFAPLVGVLLGEATLAAIWTHRLPQFELVPFGLAVVYPLLLLVGIPFFLILRRLRKLSFVTVLACALVICALGTMLVIRGAAFELSRSSAFLWSYAVLSSLFGALVFWALGTWHNTALPSRAQQARGENVP